VRWLRSRTGAIGPLHVSDREESLDPAEASRAGQQTMIIGPLLVVFAGAFALYLIYTCVPSQNVARNLSRISELMLTVVISGLTSEATSARVDAHAAQEAEQTPPELIFRRAASSLIAEAPR
jgi:hypothetical protein